MPGAKALRYAPDKLEQERWKEGPTLESLLGPGFPQARDHPDSYRLTQDNDSWVLEHWEFDDLSVKKYLMESQLSEFSSMCFPFAERDKLLWICRLVTLLFVLDEDLDRHRNLHLLPILKDLTSGKRKPANNKAELAIDKCWRAIQSSSTPENFAQFVEITHSYFDSHGQIPYKNFEQYVSARRHNVGAYFMWACLRYALNINLTNEQLEHPKIKACEDIAGFHIAYVNDLISYTKEYLTDTATNNILTLLQHNDGLSAAQAENKLRNEIKKAEDNYVIAAKAVLDDPELGKLDDVRRLVLNIPYGMGGNTWWSLVTKRYNVDPVNHPLPHVAVHIDSEMSFHPSAEPLRQKEKHPEQKVTTIPSIPPSPVGRFYFFAWILALALTLGLAFPPLLNLI